MTDERNISLTEEEIRELIANEFPRLITQNPEIRYELIGVMSETFAKKEDITAILNELKQMREESERQRVEFRQEMQVLREESEQRWREEFRAGDGLSPTAGESKSATRGVRATVG